MDLFKVIFSNTYTYTDFRYRLSVLREFVEYLLYTKEEGSLSVMEKFDRFSGEKGMSYEDIKFFKEWGESVFRKAAFEGDIYKTLEHIEERFKESPLFILRAPVIFSKEDQRYFGKWVRENVDGRAFIKIKVDESINAGCVFSWSNDQYDMSFERLRKERYDKISERIREVLDAKM
ncbi:MAG: hypothetical protein ACQEP6_00195 [Patescibacteria group bacterium]